MESPKSVLTNLQDKVGFIPLALLVTIFVALFWNSSTTSLIDTTKTINTSDAYNRTVEIEGTYMYSTGRYEPKNQAFQDLNPQIPKGNFSFAEAIVIYILVFALFLSLYSQREANREVLPWDVLKKKVEEYLGELVKSKVLIRYGVYQGFTLTTKRTDDGTATPWYFWFPAEVESEEYGVEYRMIGLDPYTGAMKHDWEAGKKFDSMATCKNCGQYYSERIITPETYDVWQERFATGKK